MATNFGKVFLLWVLSIASVTCGQGGYNPDTLTHPTTAWSLNWLLHPDDATSLTDLGFSAWLQARLADASAAARLTALGASAWQQTRLGDADAEARVRALGFDHYERPEWHGAIGNGVANDTAAFVAALAAVPEGGTLFVQAGDYLLDAWVIPGTVDKVTIQGVGVDTHFLSQSAGNSIDIEFAATFIRFADCFIDGNDSATQVFANGSYVAFDRVFFDGHTTRQIHLVSNKGTLRDCLLSNSNATACDELALAEYNDWSFLHCQFEGQDKCHCLTIDDVDATDEQMYKGRVLDCQFEGWEDTAHYAVNFAHDCQSIDIDHNYFEGSGGTTVYVADGISARGIDITSNIFQTCTKAIHLDGPASSSDFTITKNDLSKRIYVDVQSTRDANDLAYLPNMQIHSNAWGSDFKSEFIQINETWMVNEIFTKHRTDGSFGIHEIRLCGFDLDTTDATETSIYELYMRDTGGSASPSATVCRAEIFTYDDWAAGDDVHFFEPRSLVINKASTEIVASDDNGFGNAGTTGWLCAWDVTGDLARLRCTGQAATNVHWSGDVILTFKGI